MTDYPRFRREDVDVPENLITYLCEYSATSSVLVHVLFWRDDDDWFAEIEELLFDDDEQLPPMAPRLRNALIRQLLHDFPIIKDAADYLHDRPELIPVSRKPDPFTAHKEWRERQDERD